MQPLSSPAFRFLTDIGVETLTWKFRNLHPDKFPLIELRPDGLLPMAACDTLIVGRRGTGKTWLVNELLLGAMAKGNRAVLLQVGPVHGFSELDFWAQLGADLIRVTEDSEVTLSDKQMLVLDASRTLHPSFGTIPAAVFERLKEILRTLPQTGDPTVIVIEGVDSILRNSTLPPLAVPALASELKTLFRARMLYSMTQISDCVLTAGGKKLFRMCPSLILGTGPRGFGTDRPMPAGLSLEEFDLLEALDKRTPSEHDFFVKTPEGSGLGRLTPSRAERRLFEGARFDSLREELMEHREPGLTETRYRLPAWMAEKENQA